ncbi:MAG: hypothetical protein M1838_001637 [Thelocarpon superellum]|nr:MAG: hypothetical protein M1838_001637 [Thelocarpon superellum]
MSERERLGAHDMLQDHEPPTSPAPSALLPSAADRLSRSPHPYHRRRSQLTLDEGLTPNSRPAPYLPSSSPTPSPHETEGEATTAYGNGFLPRKASSDSGTEADDESLHLLKGLPAPPSRPRKGLRDSRGHSVEGALSPLLTPAFLGDAGRRFSADFGDARRLEADGGKSAAAEARTRLEVFLRKRSAELKRRGLEVLLLGAVGATVLTDGRVWHAVNKGHRSELATHLLLWLSVCVLYPLRLCLSHTRWQATPSPGPARANIRIPSAFDPAPLLYPVLLPVYAALSLLPATPNILLPNLILSLSTVPKLLIPGEQSPGSYDLCHWVLAALPMMATNGPLRTDARNPLARQDDPFDPELLIILYPLYQALLPVLRYLTTTSLLPAELHLLSICMINLLFYSVSPQTVILKALLWGGGLGLLVFCGQVLRWAVALARIPTWRFRRAGHVSQATNVFHPRSLVSKWALQLASPLKERLEEDSDADEDGLPGIEVTAPYGVDQGARPARGGDDTSPSIAALRNKVDEHAVDDGETARAHVGQGPRPSWALNVGTLHGPGSRAIGSKLGMRGREKRRTLSTVQAYLSMTPQQALRRKWFYAGYVYVVVVVMVLGGLRPYIGAHALMNHEPIGWAVGYLLGNIQWLRLLIVTSNLEQWICLPSRRGSSHCCRGWMEHLRHEAIGEGNTRLLLCTYWAAVVAVGLAVVLRLSRVVEVDTRRKVFHGMMVAMFLPATYVDPTFAGFALMLVLAVFLLLDLFRASQLPPVSRPLASFLTPYVDGRDLRGPVVVSHIFLLIGCAIPLWLSLASEPRTGTGAWMGWDVGARSVDMVSGVICVGMGDAAASLIGRRFGRRKWPWTGGKSLEGSLAFALAVTLGILLAKAWLVLGGWREAASHPARHLVQPDAQSYLSHVTTAFTHTPWRSTLLKSIAASAGASLTEAVLTGGNDNVVVPVVLWLLVRGLAI